MSEVVATPGAAYPFTTNRTVLVFWPSSANGGMSICATAGEVGITQPGPGVYATVDVLPSVWMSVTEFAAVGVNPPAVMTVGMNAGAVHRSPGAFEE
jgi:hypothetical protein